MTTGRRERSQAIGVLLCLLLSLGVLLGAATVLQAQETTGAITGQLTDEQGGVLPGATVVITNLQTGRVITLQTDGQGMYRADVDPGRYSVRYELSGFARQEIPDLNVLLGRTFTVNATLRVGNISEAVQVTAEAVPQIDVRSTVIAHNVTSEEIDRLPKGRSFQEIALTAPSVNQGEVEGGFQVNGASGAENAFTVDGVVTNSLLNGSSRQDTVFEYLQEVQVKTTGIPAEYGGALGGVISAVTKSGGNTVHGEAHYYFDGSAMSAGPVKRLVLSPLDDTTVSYVQDEEQRYQRNEIGGSIGGPIMRDRLFYFAALSPRFTRRTNEYLFRSGAEPGEIKRKQTFMQGFGKVSYSQNRFNVNGSVLFTPVRQKGVLPSYDGVAPNVLSSSLAANAPNLTRGYEIDQRNFSGTIDVRLTNSAFVSVRSGYFYDDYKDTGIPNVTSYTYRTPNIGLPGVPANLQGATGTVNTPRAIISFFDTTKRGFINADYNHAFSAGGLHSLKGGVGFQRTVNRVDQSYPGGWVYLFWDRSFTSSVTGRTDRGTYGYYEVNDFGTRGTAGGDIFHLYVQDQWTVGNRLTLNLGVRTERETIPSFRKDVKEFAFRFGFADKIAPRVGASFDLMGDGTLKLFGSWGRYFDWTKYELARGTFGGDVWKIFYRSLDTLDLNSLNLGNTPGRDLWGSASGFRDRRVPGFDTLDPLIKPMSQDSANAGLEYQLAPSTVLTLGYVHNNLIRTIEDLGVLVEGDEVYFYANPGEGAATITPVSTATAPFATPRPKRQYDAVEIGINRRFSNNWFASANYVYSRLYGNYAGLASSDEIRTPTTGGSFSADQQLTGTIARGGGNANRAWDIDEMLWDAHGNLDPRGRLATDRPHVVKLYGAYTFPTDTQVGLFFYGGSGTPITTYVNTINHTEIFAEGRGDMGRTPVLTKTDLLVSHELALAGMRRLRFELNVLNLFNQKTTRHIFNSINRDRTSAAIDLGRTNLAQGYDYNAMIRATSERAGAFEPRYRMDDLFSPGTEGRFVVKFLF